MTLVISWDPRTPWLAVRRTGRPLREGARDELRSQQFSTGLAVADADGIARFEVQTGRLWLTARAKQSAENIQQLFTASVQPDR